jgi:hypothetical protein
VDNGTWLFDGLPHRVIVMDRLRMPPSTGHITGETRKGGDAVNALFDQMPEDTVMCLTLVATPQDVLEAHLNHLSRKSVGETLASEQTRQDVQQARGLIGSAHKLYRGALAFYLRGRDLAQLDARGLQLVNVMLNAGLQPVREEDEVAPLNSYLRWLPCVFDPALDKRQWYTQLMFAQHVANLAPVWGRSQGTGHPGITFFNRGGGPITFDPLNRLDRQMNAHLFLFGPTGSGKERDPEQHPEPGDGDLSAAPVYRRGRQQLRPVRRLRRAPGADGASRQARPRCGGKPRAFRRRPPAGGHAQPGADAGRRRPGRGPRRGGAGRPMRTSSATCWANWRSRRG